MSKTPYEIRLELLHLAKEILWQPAYNKRDELKEQYHSKLTDANRSTLEYPFMPEFAGSDAIVKKAEELKRFIDQP